VARIIAGARTLAEASAWAIPYASATDPLWSASSSGPGVVRIRVTTRDGRIVASELLAGAPSHLGKMAKSVLFYLERSYTAPSAREANGDHELRISVATSRDRPNLTLGYSSERPHSYFVLDSGRRFDFEVAATGPR
jgi:hypothetical protein